MPIHSHPVLYKLEDIADSPLIPALLEKVHTESDKTLLKVRSMHVASEWRAHPRI